MLSSVFGIANGAASSESSEEALLKKQAEEMEEEENALRCLRSLSGSMEVNYVVHEMFKYNGTTILEFLCAELRRFKLNDIEFYLPQFCNLLLTRQQYPQAIEEWLIGLCRNSLHLALRTYFIIRAAVEDSIPETLKRSRLLERKLMELVLGPNSDEATISFWLDEITLVKTLTRLSSMLNSVPLEQKNTALRAMLGQLNGGLSVGLYLPITRADDPYSCLLSVVAEDAFCLPTRTRTPFMMFVEVAELGGTFGTLEASLAQYRKDKQTEASEPEDESQPQIYTFKGVPIHNATELMSKCAHPDHAQDQPHPPPQQQPCDGDHPPPGGAQPADSASAPEAQAPPEAGSGASPAVGEKSNARRAREPQVFDYEQLLAAMEEQKREWAQYLKEEQRIPGADPLPSPQSSSSSTSSSMCTSASSLSSSSSLSTSSMSAAEGGTSTKGGILALSEKLKTIVKKVENDKEALISQLAALQETEKADALVDSPLGDDYFITSVEEFYCDVLEKGQLKMSKPTTTAPGGPTPYYSARARSPSPRLSFGDDDAAADGDTDEWVVVPDGEKEMRRTRYELMTAAYKELWTDRKKRIQQQSPFGGLPGWNLQAVIVKSEDDLRQEQMAMQLIKAFSEIFSAKRLPLWLRPYEIVAASSSTGFIEVVPDAVSIDAIKRRNPDCPTLTAYFLRTYGERHTPTFKAALRNFVESLAGYSLVCYFLQIKDRHNGNILLDIYGHIVHIDYGFLLGTGPGTWVFEKAPFKLTAEYVELMGGETSDTFRYFSMLLISGFLEVRNHYHRIINIVEMMLPGYKIGCLNETTVPMLRDRFKVTLSPDECQAFAQSLINEAMGSWRTKHYDNFQLWTNGILP